MMKHDSLQPLSPNLSLRLIKKSKVKDRERTSEGFVYTRNRECGISNSKRMEGKQRAYSKKTKERKTTDTKLKKTNKKNF